MAKRPVPKYDFKAFGAAIKAERILEITGVDIDKVIDGRIVEHGGSANAFETFFEHHLIRPV